jgi:polysaccharide pyruvyl transferase WcaK-like protein
MNRIVMFEHGGSGNHGCEAIVRSTISILGQNKYYLESNCPDEDVKYGITQIANLIHSNDEHIVPNSLLDIYLRLMCKFTDKRDFDERESLYRHKKLLFENSIALSIGGDNYCYGAVVVNSMRDKLKAFKHNGTKTVLWGCSIEPEKINPSVLIDLKAYDLITVRESLTADLLQKHEIANSVIRCADPAFTLKIQETSWNAHIFSQSKVIGINVSDLMRNYDSYPNATYKNFYRLIQYITENTDYNIVMIPHVIKKGNDDRIPIANLASEFDLNRIFVVDEDFNCMQLKHIISKCNMFIGCRTHSTIASYSTCVPTLVVGYSVKAKGLCRDIFGSDSDLLVDAREFKTDFDLTNKFISFVNQENEIRNHLKNIMPDYIKRAYAPKDAVLKLL